jgi:hypothetical protein
MTKLASALVALLVALLVAAPAEARRLPAPGGKATVALPQELLTPTMEAHTYVPLVEPADAARALARPPLPGMPAWRSSVLAGLAAESGGRVWRLTPRAPEHLVLEALERCFLADARAGSWPADALRARGMKPSLELVGDDVIVRSTAPIGPMPELLAGCLLRGKQATANGAYTLAGPGMLAWRSGGFADPPLLGVVELRGLGERADLMGGTNETMSGGVLLAPFPDVVLLLQSSAANKADRFGLRDEKVGLRGFRQALRADLMVAAYGAGRGAAAQGLLPPGIAPARPLALVRGLDKAAPLSLTVLGPDAPRVVVRRSEGDPLVDGVIERIAVLLRTRGTGIELVRPDRDPLRDGIELLRWRPPTSDPALALLALAGKRPELVDEPSVKKALEDPRLLSERGDERLAAALALERAWLDAFAVVPLMTAERWFTIDPDLRGVQIRADGVPLLVDAYWGSAR